MLAVAIAALTLAALMLVAFGGVVRSLVRQQARERGLLLDQIMHLSGRTWTPPPSESEPEPWKPPATVRSPEQLPEQEWG